MMSGEGSAGPWPGACRQRKVELARQRWRVVLVSAPGLVQRATVATLETCPHVDLAAVVSGSLSATRVLATVQPDLILIDANLPNDEVEALLSWAAENCPAVQCVVATSTSQHRDQALSSGAHSTVYRASLASHLEAIFGCSPN